MKVLITDKINETAKDIIGNIAECDFLPTMTEDELCQKIKDYDALMVRSQTKVTKKIIDNADKLKIIGRAGVGVDNIDLDAATQKGIIVVNSPDGNTNAASEHTIALILALSRNIPEAVISTKAGKWERSKFTGSEVFGKTIGIIGLGKIGTHVANVCLSLGMKVIVCDPYTSKESVEKIGAEYIPHLDEFWGKCDYITIHTPKTKETTYLINKNSLNRMKKGVKIINCARGGIIDEMALAEAIQSGQVAGCALDVFEKEPDISSCPLLNLNEGKIILTPHLGASTNEAQLNVAIDVANQIKSVLSGGDASSAVNLPGFSKSKLEPIKEYMSLAENIAEVASQIKTGNIKNIDFTVFGELTQFDVKPLEIALLKGVFSNKLEGVNYVNAPILAKQRGINIKTSKSSKNINYLGLLNITITTDSSKTSVSGALIAQNIPRIVKIDDFNTSIKPEKHMLTIPHTNKPAMVAKVASVIANYDININHMQVAQKSNIDDNISIMIINTQTNVEDQVLNEICNIDGVLGAKYINLHI